MDISINKVIKSLLDQSFLSGMYSDELTEKFMMTNQLTYHQHE